MNRFQSTALEASIFAFSRARRSRDGDVIRDLALDMIEDGKPMRRQAASLVVAGLSDRFNALGSNPTSAFVRRGLFLLAALLAPVLFVIVSASFAAIVFFDVPSPNNELATGFSLSRYSLVHAGLPWALSLVGAFLACIGFSTGRRSVARVGSISVLIGAWLVVGTMGGWFAGEGFVGPAELPLGREGDEFRSSIYVIAPIAAISFLLAIGSIFMPRDKDLTKSVISPLTAVLPGILAVPLVGVLSLLDYRFAAFACASLTVLLIALPSIGLILRRSESTREYAAFVTGVAVVFLAVPSLLLFDQLLASTPSFDLVFAPTVYFGLILVAILAGATTAVRSLRSARAGT